MPPISSSSVHLPEVTKYPRTMHLFDSGGTATATDDLVLKDLEAVVTMFEKTIIVEEKVDGANLGLRAVSGEILVQNRSRYISSGDHAQFSRIEEWVSLHRHALLNILGGDLILFGEWCAAKHSLLYDKLPDHFVAFDLYDCKAGRFYSRERFHTKLQSSGIAVVPTITTQAFLKNRGPKTQSKQAQMRTKKGRHITPWKKKHDGNLLRNQITALLDTNSVFRKEGTVEGVVLRQDDGDWLEHRYKVVRPDFVRGCGSAGHWNRRPIQKQVVDYAFGEEYRKVCCVFASLATTEKTRTKKNIEIHSESFCTEKPAKMHAQQKKGRGDQQKQALQYVAKKTRNEKRQAALDKQHAHTQKMLRHRVPRCILLCGLPGSGKSTFASRLKAGIEQDSGSCSTTSTIEHCWVANQDMLDRKECVRVAGKASHRTRMIIDRCNLTASERSEWLEYMHSPSFREVALVFFDVAAEKCIERVQNRDSHPTIAHGKGAKIIEQLSRKREPPTLQERQGIFGTIERIETTKDSEDLLRKWGISPT